MVTMIDVATFLGLLVILQLVLFALFYIVQTIRVLINIAFPPNFVIKFGKWAVVTGSSDGIGLQYARQLARRGMNVVLMSYVKEQLLEAAKNIELDFKVQTKSIVVDFSEERHIYELIARELKDLDIGILVNNVGVIVPHPMGTIEMTEKQIWNHVSVNILAGTMMTKLLLPDMKIRKRGAIVNIASTAAINPLPYLNLYAASKAYVDYMSRGLQVECMGSGVTIQTLVPGFINTSMIGFSKTLQSAGFLVPPVTTFVKHAVCTLGVLNHTTGYMPHGIQHCVLSTIPDWLYVPGASAVFKLFRSEYNASQTTNKN